MKVISIMGILAGWVGLAVLGGSPAYSQSEVAPDHFESSNVEPFEKLSLAKAKQQFANHSF